MYDSRSSALDLYNALRASSLDFRSSSLDFGSSVRVSSLDFRSSVRVSSLNFRSSLLDFRSSAMSSLTEMTRYNLFLRTEVRGKKYVVDMKISTYTSNEL